MHYEQYILYEVNYFGDGDDEEHLLQYSADDYVGMLEHWLRDPSLSYVMELIPGTNGDYRNYDVGFPSGYGDFLGSLGFAHQALAVLPERPAPKPYTFAELLAAQAEHASANQTQGLDVDTKDTGVIAQEVVELEDSHPLKHVQLEGNSRLQVSPIIQAYVAQRVAGNDGIKHQMDVVCETMRQDPDYAWGWHCNIAMSFVDEGGDWVLANKAAARFLKILADVDTTKHIGFAPVLEAAGKRIGEDRYARLSNNSYLITNNDQALWTARDWHSKKMFGQGEPVDMAPLVDAHYAPYSNETAGSQAIVTYSLSKDPQPRVLASYTFLGHLAGQF